MQARYGRALLIAGLAMLAARGDAPAQSRTHTVHTDHGGRFEVHSTGEVVFRDDDRGVARLGPGARLSIEEARRGRVDRRVEFRPAAGGGVRTLYFEDGESRAPDADDRAWIEHAVLRAIRDGGVGAERRVARIRAREGTAGVLREIERIEGDGGKRTYYRALLATPGMRAGETESVVRHLARQIHSDGDKSHALWTVLDRPLGPTELAAVLDAAATIHSDGDLARLLSRVAREHTLRDARVRQAFFRAAEGIQSDGDLARVLMTVLRRDGVDGGVAVSALRTAREIASDGDLARVLMTVPAGALRDRAVRAAYGDALSGIASDGDRERAERHLARSAS